MFFTECSCRAARLSVAGVASFLAGPRYGVINSWRGRLLDPSGGPIGRLVRGLELGRHVADGHRQRLDRQWRDRERHPAWRNMRHALTGQ